MFAIRPIARSIISRPRHIHPRKFPNPILHSQWRQLSNSRHFYNKPTPDLQDGLKNNRDVTGTKGSSPSPASSISTSDLDLLSKLPKTSEQREPVPSYAMVFTCKKCRERSAHKISKQGYHNGTVLITCPSCKNRHLIADHLKIFSDSRVTLEDILANKGDSLRKVAINESGDVEIVGGDESKG